ncbi:sensor histidine kinase [Aquabacterium sp. OR-4]|uniref:sensor histidine kinase n=1 Tax=Aquabacterium sp. OR-4 TaxID=2978127 RepID=UPI0021B46FE4|nr:ATP-binding protein [Aquabacterium sp. OR-4]MDT7838865.1 ATP-binding protein [Aquabacterium sp. OR-4]
MLARLPDALSPRRSLRARFALLIGASGLALALLSALVLERTQRAQLTELRGLAMHREAVLLGRTLDSALRLQLQQLRDTATHPLLASGLVEPGDARLLLENLRAQQPALAWLAIVDPQGRVQVATNALLEGADLADEPWFAPARQAPYVGTRRRAGPLTASLGLVNGEQPSLIDLGVPLVDMQGRPLGVLAARLRWEWLDTLFQSLQADDERAQGSQSLVLGRDDKVLLGPPERLDSTLAVTLNAQAVRAVLDWPGEGPYLSAWAREPGAVGLTVLVRQPTALAFRAAEQLSQRLLLLGVLGTLGFIGLSIWLAGRVARPIQELSAAALRVVHDEPPQFETIAPQRADEVAEVARALQTLHAELMRRLAEQQRAQAQLRELNAGLEQRVLTRTAELSAANAELDAFAYAVSHDLRAPLRAMSGFSQALLEDHGPALDAQAQAYLGQIIQASARMGELIEGLLTLSRSVRGVLGSGEVDLGVLAEQALADLRRAEPQRVVQVSLAPGLRAQGDRRMLGAVMANLLGNAWKYTAGRADAQIEVGMRQIDGERWFFVRDNGVGFDMAHGGRLFKVFARLHRQDEFPGLGIGLATVQRIIHRHGGRVMAESALGAGATFRFTLPERPPPLPTESA